MRTDDPITFRPDPRPAEKNSGGYQCFMTVKSSAIAEKIKQAIEDEELQYTEQGVKSTVVVVIKK